MVKLAQAVPKLTIVVDHVGGPLGIGPFRGKQAEVYPEWKQRMMELAALPNVRVKLGGLTMFVNGFDFHKNPKPPGSEELAKTWAPYIETCIEAFGATRCMFEATSRSTRASCSCMALVERLEASLRPVQVRRRKGRPVRRHGDAPLRPRSSSRSALCRRPAGKIAGAPPSTCSTGTDRPDRRVPILS